MVYFKKIANSSYNYRLFVYQNFRTANFENEFFTKLTTFVTKKSNLFKKIGIRHYFLVIIFKLYNLLLKINNISKFTKTL